jgi:hypothetical protein
MSDELDKAQIAKEIQSELKAGRMSRRRLLDSLKILGVGFGATYVAGADSAKAAALSLGSTNSALNNVIRDAQADPAMAPDGGADAEPRLEQAQFYYRRYWRYRRFWRYRRYWYRRYWRYRRYWYRRW